MADLANTPEPEFSVPVDALIEALKARVSALTWENVVLNARITANESTINDLMSSKAAAPPSE